MQTWKSVRFPYIAATVRSVEFVSGSVHEESVCQSPSGMLPSDATIVAISLVGK